MNFDNLQDISAPWLKFYGEVPHHLDYPEGSMLDVVAEIAKKYPAYPAFTFMGKKTTYQQMMEQVQTRLEQLKK